MKESSSGIKEFVLEKNIKVKATLLTKEYSLAQSRSDKLKSLFSLFKSKVPTFWALRGVNLEVHTGETIGIIGLNGSGKSTLSNIIAGITPQTSGQLEINGEVSIISIGAGLNNNLTGRENIRMKCLMMGEKNRQIDAKIDDIIEFSELGVFIDQPVKTYSSGMRSKLGFSIAVHQDPDILVIDEALSVGDTTFYNKGLKRMLTYKEQGKTIFFVSHSLQQVRQICDKVLWMHYGEAKAFGDKETILKQYGAFVKEYNKKSEAEKEAYQKLEKDKQRSYSLKELQDEMLEERRDNLSSRRSMKQVVATTTKNRIGDKMSIPMKIFTLLLAFFIAYFSLAYVKGVSITQAVTRPAYTLNRFTKPAIDPNAPKPLINKPPVESSAKASKSGSSAKSSESKTSTSESSTIETEQYVVELPDTLETLAATYQITTEELQQLNPSIDFSTLAVGQVINVPVTASTEESASATNETTYTVEEGDSQGLIAEKYGMTLAELQELNPELLTSSIHAGQVLKVREVTE
jgi:teichoic acid transport system ATP-binding protein